MVSILNPCAIESFFKLNGYIAIKQTMDELVALAKRNLNEYISQSIAVNTDQYQIIRKSILINASMVAAFIGEHSRKHINEAINDKIAGASFRGNKYTFHGNKYEPVAKQTFELQFDAKVYDIGLVIHPDYKDEGASPDGVILYNNTGKMELIEIKCPETRELSATPPHYYLRQIEHQLECCRMFDTCRFWDCKIKNYKTVKGMLKYISTRPKAWVYCGCVVSKYITNYVPDQPYDSEYTADIDVNRHVFTYLPSEFIHRNTESNDEAEAVSRMTRWMNETIGQQQLEYPNDEFSCSYWLLVDFATSIVNRNTDWERCFRDKLQEAKEKIKLGRDSGQLLPAVSMFNNDSNFASRYTDDELAKLLNEIDD